VGGDDANWFPSDKLKQASSQLCVSLLSLPLSLTSQLSHLYQCSIILIYHENFTLASSGCSLFTLSVCSSLSLPLTCSAAVNFANSTTFSDYRRNGSSSWIERENFIATPIFIIESFTDHSSFRLFIWFYDYFVKIMCIVTVDCKKQLWLKCVKEFPCFLFSRLTMQSFLVNKLENKENLKNNFFQPLLSFNKLS
jgi:hypothetical protein